MTREELVINLLEAIKETVVLSKDARTTITKALDNAYTAGQESEATVKIEEAILAIGHALNSLGIDPELIQELSIESLSKEGGIKKLVNRVEEQLAVKTS